MTGGKQQPPLGERLAAARRRGWTREELAVRAGLSVAGLAQIETGRRPNPRAHTLAALARGLGVSSDYLGGNGVGQAMLRHQALIHSGSERFLEAAGPMLAKAVAGGEPALAVLDPAKRELLREYLGNGAGEVEFADSVAWYSTPAAAVRRYRDFIERTLGAGAHWLNVLVEPVWEGRSEAETALWLRYESLLNLVFAGVPATVVCCYDEAALPAEIVAGACATHSHTIAGEETKPSPDFRDPSEFCLES